MQTYKLIIADDENIIRDGLATGMDWEGLGFCVCGVFASGNEVIRYLEEHEVDVLFTDVVMADGTGLDAARWVNAYRPDMRVILLTGYADFESERMAIECRVVQHMIMKPTSPAHIRHVFAEVLGELLLRDAQKAEPLAENAPVSSADDQLIQKIHRYIVEHLSEGVTLGQVARYTHFSPSHLSRLIKEKTGESFTECQMRFRMAEASRLLAESSFKVSEIGRQVGYGDIRHFTRVFRRYVGMTPSEFRKRSE